MYFHRRQTCTKCLSKPKFVTCNLKSELNFFHPYTKQTNIKVRMHAETKKHTLALSDILDEFEINRLGKLLFRTVVSSFSSKDRRTDIASDDIRFFFFMREKKR